MCLLTSHTAAESTATSGIAELGSAGVFDAYSCANPRHARWQLSAGLALLSGLVHWGVDLRFVLHPICSLMQQTQPAASVARIKRLSALCELEGTRVRDPFLPFLSSSPTSSSPGFFTVVAILQFAKAAHRAQHYVDLTCPPKPGFSGDYFSQGSDDSTRVAILPATGNAWLISSKLIV